MYHARSLIMCKTFILFVSLKKSGNNQRGRERGGEDTHATAAGLFFGGREKEPAVFEGGRPFASFLSRRPNCCGCSPHNSQ